MPIPVREPAEYFLWRDAGIGRPASSGSSLRANRGLEGMLAAPLPLPGVGGRASLAVEAEPFHIDSKELDVWPCLPSEEARRLSWDWFWVIGRKGGSEELYCRWSLRLGEGGTLLDDWAGTLPERGGRSDV